MRQISGLLLRMTSKVKLQKWVKICSLVEYEPTVYTVLNSMPCAHTDTHMHAHTHTQKERQQEKNTNKTWKYKTTV